MTLEQVENIRVIGRFRPLNEREKGLERAGSAPPRFGDNGCTVWVGPDENSGNYALDAILTPDATQVDAFTHATTLVEAVMQGYNATLLAYGQVRVMHLFSAITSLIRCGSAQTGSGKTHSVMGELGGDESQLGLLPRAVRQIFESICADAAGADFAVSCSYLEIYKEAVRDLLNPSSEVTAGWSQPNGRLPSLAIREAVGKGVYVDGLTEVPVMGEGDVLDCVECGNAARMVGSTLMNAHSSRSHALLTINLRQKMPDGSTKVSRLNIADLAGSEKVSKTGSSGETLEEAKKINASLSALCLVIAALSDAKPHIPYRNSKLTRILQESLGGNSKTMMIVCCSPSANNGPETHSTMRFATRAKKVRNSAVVNRVRTTDQLESANAALRLELQSARERIARLEVGDAGGSAGGTNGAEAPGTASEAHAEELEALREQCGALEHQLEETKLELDDEKREGAGLRTQVSEAEAEMSMLYDTLARFQVLHGVAPSRYSAGKRNSREAIDRLRRQLVDLEALALQTEMGTLDQSEGGPAAVERLKLQLADQHRRIRELEPLAEVAANARAAEQEVTLLKEQLQQLAQQTLQRVSTRARRQSAMHSTMSSSGSFRAVEASGQHVLRSIGEEPETASRQPTPPPNASSSGDSATVGPQVLEEVQKEREQAQLASAVLHHVNASAIQETEAELDCVEIRCLEAVQAAKSAPADLRHEAVADGGNGITIEQPTAPPAAAADDPAPPPPPPSSRRDSAAKDDLPAALMGGLAGGWVGSKRERRRSKRSTLAGSRESMAAAVSSLPLSKGRVFAAVETTNTATAMRWPAAAPSTPHLQSLAEEEDAPPPPPPPPAIT